MVVSKLENIPLYEVSVSRKRPRKEVSLQVTLEGGYSSASECIRSFHSVHNVVDRSVLIQAMWEELAGKVGA